MKKTQIMLMLVMVMVIGICSMVHAQTISRKVISGGGGVLTSGSNMVTFTIGETVIPTLASGGNIITQGFQQPGEELHIGTLAASACAGDNMSITYTAIDIGGGNTFTAQLSNASGSFATPVNIGTLAGNASGSISAIIPANTPPGNGYRIRVLSTNPSLTGSDNGSDIAINSSSAAATSATSNASYGEICLNNTVTLTANGGLLGSGSSWKWYEGGCGNGAPIGTGSPLTITPLTTGTHTYFVRAEGPCGNTFCQSVIINVISAPPVGTVHISTAPSDGCVAVAPQTISLNAVSGASFYHWSSGQAGVLFNGNPSPFETTIPTVNITFTTLPAAGSSGWSICCFGGNACGNTNTICTWVRATLSQPGPIIGSVIGCPGSSNISYSSPSVAGAASYQWSSTGGIVITGNGAQAITVTFPAGFVTGTLKVHGQTSCGYNGPDRTITITAVPAIPGTVSGPSYPCPNASATYGVAAVPGAVSYLWTTSAPGAVVTGNTNSCSIVFGPSIPGGSIVSVVAISNCPSSSAVRSKGIASGMPGVPSSISGPASGQCGEIGVSYSINPVALAIGYNWSASCGTIVGPTNLSGITVDWPASFTNCVLTVSATNNCGTGAARNLTIISNPITPPAISGNAIPCANAVEFYSTTGSAGATSYNWTIPSGAVILGPPNGASILVQWGAASGNISVQATNGCGSSTLRTLPCVISCRMGQVQNSAGTFDVEVYPNPAFEKLTIHFSSCSQCMYSLQLIDELGRLLIAKEGTAIQDENIIDLNVASLAKGIYTLQFITNDKSQQTKVVIE